MQDKIAPMDNVNHPEVFQGSDLTPYRFGVDYYIVDEDRKYMVAADDAADISNDLVTDRSVKFIRFVTVDGLWYTIGVTANLRIEPDISRARAMFSGFRLALKSSDWPKDSSPEEQSRYALKWIADILRDYGKAVRVTSEELLYFLELAKNPKVQIEDTRPKRYA